MGSSLPTRAKGCTKFRSIEKNDLRIWSLYQCDFGLSQLLEEKNLVLVLEFIEFERSVGTYRFHLAVPVFLHKNCIPWAAQLNSDRCKNRRSLPPPLENHMGNTVFLKCSFNGICEVIACSQWMVCLQV